MYATTWGNADPAKAALNYHSLSYLTYLRNFVEAVLKYTGAKKINIISHSMGVTLGRKVIKGGAGYDGGKYDLGPSLADKVETFIGISGGNWGLTACFGPGSVSPTCSPVNGFYPGISIGPIGLSKYLSDLNNKGGKESKYLFTIYSFADEVICCGDLVYGKLTTKIPN